MISFIVIGKNEGQKLTACFNSIFHAVKLNDLQEYEVIYVDSQSTDDSLERAQAFDKLKIFLINGTCNAAIARNIGAQEASGDILFFIDGDMEIESDFIEIAFVNNDLVYPFLTGHVEDYLYDNSGTFFSLKPRTYIKSIPDKEEIQKTMGGIFLIKRDVWQIANGFKTKYKIHEDIDLSLRLANLNVYNIRLPKKIATHHTNDYYSIPRMWHSLLQGHFAYHPVIWRDHFTKPIVWKRMIFKYPSAMFLSLCLLTLPFSMTYFYILSFIYFILLILRGYKHFKESIESKNKLTYLINKLFIQLIADLSFWLGLLFFYPKNRDERYERIK